MDTKFTPPYPKAYKSKIALTCIFPFKVRSWIHVLSEKTYRMKLGRMRLPRTHFWVVNDKALVKKIMAEEPDNFPKHHMFHEMLSPLLGESIFTTNGDRWKNQRKMMNPSFTHTNLKKVFGTMQACVSTLTEMIEEKWQAEPINVEPLMTYVTADIIFRTILSSSLTQDQAVRVFKEFDRFQTQVQIFEMIKLFKGPSFGIEKKIKKSAANIHDIFAALIRTRFEEFKLNPEKKYDNILDSLMRATHPESGDGFSFEELIDQMSIIFLAGHETSASALTWALYLMASCDDVQERVYREVIGALIGDEITYESSKSLSYTKNVFMEGLRLYPPVSFLVREASTRTCMRGKDIEKGSPLIVSPWLIHRSENHWTDPHVFCPARFDDKDQKDAVRDSYLPFGKGQRICVGAGFAYQEALLVLASIIKDYKLINPKGQKPEPISRLTTRPKNGIKLIFEKRKS